MNSLTLSKSILKSRSLEFTRLLLLSMLEGANDTFSVILSLLSSELAQCNLSSDQYLQTLTKLLNELRAKISSNEDEDLNSTTSSFMDFNVPTTQQASALKNADIVVLDDDNGLQNNRFSIAETGNSMPLFLNGHPVVSTNNGIIQHAPMQSKNTKQLLNQCNMCKKFVSNEEKFYFSVGLCSSCYQREWKRRHDFDAIDSTQINQPPQQQMSNNSLHNPNNRACKRCRKIVSLTLRKFKGYCSACYYKTQRLHRPKPFDYSSVEGNDKDCNSKHNTQLGDRQCSDCQKVVSKSGVFYRTARLCKNCYERHRLHIRKTKQIHCVECQSLTNGSEILNGKCISCNYREIHTHQNPPSSNDPLLKNAHQMSSSRKESNEQQFGQWGEPLEESSSQGNEDHMSALLNLCPDLTNCQSCNKLTAQEDLNNEGNCRTCQAETPIKMENL